MEGDEDRSLVCVLNAISIHSLRMEGDPSPTWEASKPMPFQSTPSAWRETSLSESVSISEEISIHSLRMEGDFCQYASGFTLCHFNPLPPHGGRRSHSEIGRNHIKDFNPLPPHGGRLNDIVDSLLPLHFNPLPPHGGRLSRETFFSTCVPFQSTPSAWRETYDIDGNGDWITFQSTPSAWRETLGAFDEIGVYSISIHSLRMEGDTHNGYNLSTYD